MTRDEEFEQYYEEKERIKAEERGLTPTEQSSKCFVVPKPTREHDELFLKFYNANLKKLSHSSQDFIFKLSRCELIGIHSEMVLVPEKHWRNLL